MIFRRVMKKLKEPCSKCGKIDENTFSEVFIIDTPDYITMFRICESCQIIEELETEISIENRRNVKLGLR